MHIKSNNQVINNYFFDIMHKDGTPAQPRQFLFLVARVAMLWTFKSHLVIQKTRSWWCNMHRKNCFIQNWPFYFDVFVVFSQKNGISPESFKFWTRAFLILSDVKYM